MKKVTKLFPSIVFLFMLLWTPVLKVSAQPGVSVSFQAFYDDLSPYGTWVEDPQYGNVWVPNEGRGFRPYHTHGHWVLTDYGNTWVSDDPWGWAPYHYGRWTYDPYYGWVWVPGYEWAPAWVSWRYSDDYCGWAPLSPGISIGVSYNCPNDWWVFVGPQYLYRPDYDRYWRGPRYNSEIIGRTRFENNPYIDNSTRVRYNYGPRPEEIQRVTHQQVPVYKVAHAERPGAPQMRGNSVAMFRPNVNRAANARPDPAHMMQAPRPIGRPQAATANGSRDPAFHSVVQQQRQSGRPDQGANRQAPMGRSELQGQRPQQPQNRPQQVPQGRPDQGAYRQQQIGRPEQQRPQQGPQGRPQQPQNRPQQQAPQGRPDQGAYRQAQMGRPEPQRQQQPMSRPEPPHQPQPMQRPEPHMTPPPQRQAPPPQPQHQAPQQQPRQEAPHEAPHGEGQGHERR